MQEAFDNLGTQIAVADFFDVSRPTVLEWAKEYNLSTVSRPEIPRARRMSENMSKLEDRVRVAQWIIDEGSVSSYYNAINDNTVLCVSGEMADLHSLKLIGRILCARVNNARTDMRDGWMPLSYIRVSSAAAYSLLRSIRTELVGLKREEAEAALLFFPTRGRVKGRHTTTEFLIPAWITYARENVLEWNKNRLKPVSEQEATRLINSWILARVKRAKMFVDSKPRKVEGKEIEGN